MERPARCEGPQWYSSTACDQAAVCIDTPRALPTALARGGCDDDRCADIARRFQHAVDSKPDGISSSRTGNCAKAANRLLSARAMEVLLLTDSPW